MTIQPYLMFDGRCDEALAFYRDALGAETTALMRFGDAPDMPPPPEGEQPGGCAGGAAPPADKVMHAEFRIGDTTLLASDGMCGGAPRFEGVSLTLPTPDDAKAEQLFARLAESGQVQMPMTTTFFASRFGMVADRFGVSWMVICAPEAARAAGGRA